MAKTDRNTWAYVAGKRLKSKDTGTLGRIEGHPEDVVNPVTGEWRPKVAKKLKGIANKVLGVSPGRKVEDLREVTPHEERPVPSGYLDGISCDPRALASYALHRNHKPKTLRLTQTGGVSAEQKLTVKQKELLARLESQDKEVRAAAKVEAEEYLRQRALAKDANIDDALDEMGYAQDSVPRAETAHAFDDDDDEYEVGIFPLDDDDEPDLDYLSIDLEDQDDD